MPPSNWLIPVSGNVPLPSKIKCVRCGIFKNPEAFTEKRRKELQEQIIADRRFDAAKVAFIPCNKCTPNVVFEIECTGCKKGLPRDKFSKTQARNPDTALCWVCQEGISNILPGGHDSDEDEYDCEKADPDDEALTWVGGKTRTSSTVVGSRSGKSLSSSGYTSHGLPSGGVSLAAGSSNASSVPRSGGPVPRSQHRVGSSTASSAQSDTTSTFSDDSEWSGSTVPARQASRPAAYSKPQQAFAKIPSTRKVIMSDAARAVEDHVAKRQEDIIVEEPKIDSDDADDDDVLYW